MVQCAAHRQLRGVERTQAQRGDHDDRGVQFHGEVGEGPVLPQPDEDPARPLDEQDPVRVGGVEGPQPARDIGQLCRRHARPACGEVRGQRLGIAVELVEVGDPGEPVHGGQIATVGRSAGFPGLDEFDHTHPVAVLYQVHGECGGGDGLADIGAGPGDADDHACTSALSAASTAARTPAQIVATSPVVLMNGGMT